MFDLLSPVFFYVMGSIGVLIPLVLHLIQSRRTIKVPFSTIRFLKLAQEKSSTRIKMENILLWIIRTLLLVILALAFAMPMLRSKGAGRWMGRSPRDVAIVIDGSYSMDYNLGRSTVWQKAIDTASAVIDGLGEQDRFCIYVARDHVEPVIEQLSSDKEEGLSRLKALAFSQGSSQLAPAVMEANDSLAEAEARREREIHIITDTQALPWESFGGGDAAAAVVVEDEDESEADSVTRGGDPVDDARTGAAMGVWDPRKIDEKRTTFFVSLLGVDTPENLSPVQIKIEPPLVLANFPSKATVRLGHTGPPKGTTVTLQIDEKDVGTQSITLANDQTAEMVFTVPPLKAGWHQATVELPDDNLVLDNTFHAILRVEDRFPTLCVGAQEDTVFIRAALKAGQSGGGGIEAEWVEVGAISEDKLAEYACVFLCNAIPLGASEVAALEKFVDAGGLLAVFPGGAALPGDYQTLTCLPAIPVAIEQVGQTKRKQILHWDARRSAVLESLRLGESTLSAVIRKRLVIDKLEDRAQQIISHGGDAAFLLGRPVGRGYVLLFTVSADRTWSDFPLSPFYLPVIHQIVEFGAGVGSHPQFVWCTPNLPLGRCLPEATHDTELVAPDGKRVPVRSAVVGTRTVLYVEDLMTAGIYGVTPADGGSPVPSLAVNMVRKESDLTPLDASNMAGRLSVKRVEVARDIEQLLTHIQESRVGRTFGEQLLWVVLILAGVEFCLANRLTQESPSLTGKLGLDASGKVPSVAAALEGGGVVMTVYEHTIPTLLIWLGVLAAIGAGAFSVWRWGPRTLAMGVISGLYVLFLFLLLWCLLLPGNRTVETRTLKPRFVVALDTSRSMLLSPGEGISNRWSEARKIMAMPWKDSVGAECEIDVYAFHTEVSRQMPLDQATELEPDGDATLLRDALQKITGRYAGMNVAGGLVLTDGIDTREAFDEWAADSRPFKLYTVQLEPDAVWEEEPDLRVDAVQTPKRVTVNWQTELKAVISGQGAVGAVNVQLLKDNALIQEIPTQVPKDGGSRQVKFELTHPDIGIYTYKIVVPPLPKESNTNDNEYAVSVQVIDAKNRLLYVEGAPRWESKYLKRALQANKKATPLIFLHGPDGKPMSFGAVGSMTPEMTEDQLSFFKIVVIGNLDAEEIGERRALNLIKYVESGGSLVLLGGAKGWGAKGFAQSSLRKLLPVKSYNTKAREGEFPISITDTGRAHPAFAGDSELWDIIPPILSVFPVSQPSQVARNLVVAQTPEGSTPLILSQPYGQGKVVAVFTDSLWKWQLHPQANSTRPYQRFWDQLISWLLPQEDEVDKDKLSIFADQETLVLGEEIKISARVGGEEAPAGSVQCEIELPKGEKRPFVMRSEPVATASGKTFPGFVTAFKVTEAGLHNVTASAVVGGRKMVSDPLSFYVKPFSAESIPRAVNAGVLKSVAESSGGRFFKDYDALDKTLASLRFPTIEEETSEFRSLWQTWFVIACLTLLATVSWVLRKMNSMP